MNRQPGGTPMQLRQPLVGAERKRVQQQQGAAAAAGLEVAQRPMRQIRDVGVH